MASFRLSSEPDAAPDEARIIIDAVNNFNMDVTRVRDFRPLQVFLCDDDDRIVGGILGDMWGGWLHITYLWVAPELRQQGYGSRLLGAAEDEARARGIHRVFLETHSFQAPEFYRQHGYLPLGQLEDYPPGHDFLIFWKAL